MSHESRDLDESLRETQAHRKRHAVGVLCDRVDELAALSHVAFDGERDHGPWSEFPLRCAKDFFRKSVLRVGAKARINHALHVAVSLEKLCNGHRVLLLLSVAN